MMSAPIRDLVIRESVIYSDYRRWGSMVSAKVSRRGWAKERRHGGEMAGDQRADTA